MTLLARATVHSSNPGSIFKTWFQSATRKVLVMFVQSTDLYLWEISHSAGLINKNCLTSTTLFCTNFRITHNITYTSPLSTTIYRDVNTAPNYECTTVCDWEKELNKKDFQNGCEGGRGWRVDIMRTWYAQVLLIVPLTLPLPSVPRIRRPLACELGKCQR